MERRNWTDIEPGKYSLFEYEVSKKVTFLLRHSQKVHREDDGAVHFWRIRKIFRMHSHSLFIGLTVDGKHAWQLEEEQKGRFQYCTDSSVHFRALQGHSGRNLIYPSLQDNVLIGPGIFPYI